MRCSKSSEITPCGYAMFLTFLSHRGLDTTVLRGYLRKFRVVY